MGTGSFPGLKCDRGVLLTTHPLLAPRSWKCRAIPLPPLWATNRPVTGLLYFFYCVFRPVLRHITTHTHTIHIRSCHRQIVGSWFLTPPGVNNPKFCFLLSWFRLPNLTHISKITH